MQQHSPMAMGSNLAAELWLGAGSHQVEAGGLPILLPTPWRHLSPRRWCQAKGKALLCACISSSILVPSDFLLCCGRMLCTEIHRVLSTSCQWVAFGHTLCHQTWVRDFHKHFLFIALLLFAVPHWPNKLRVEPCFSSHVKTLVLYIKCLTKSYSLTARTTLFFLRYHTLSKLFSNFGI